MKRLPRTAPATPSSAAVATTTPELSLARSEVGQVLMQLQAQGSSSQRMIADYLLRNSVSTVAAGIDELAQRIGTSTATLSRFARAAGFQQFAQLKSALAESVKAVFAPVQKLASSQALSSRQASAGQSDRAARTDEAAHLFAPAQTNVQQTALGMDSEALRTVAHAVIRARAVYTVGFGLSSHIAAILALDLQPFCEQLTNLVEFGGTEVAAGKLMNVGPKDLVLVISVPRYATDAVNLANYARDRGATVVALTDAPASPLTAIAQHALFAPAQHPVLSSSLVAILALVEALVSVVMLASPNSVQQAARLTEAISDYMYGGQSLRAQRIAVGAQPEPERTGRIRKG
jgi:DNA-binding MurR/RpiR family transcriptional regulator